jgi:hypothetical protein
VAVNPTINTKLNAVTTDILSSSSVDISSRKSNIGSGRIGAQVAEK